MKKVISIFIAMLLVMSLTACGSKGERSGQEESGTDSPKEETVEDDKPEITITQTPAEQMMATMTAYQDVNGCFTAMIPEGWSVSTAGYDMLYWIRIYSNTNPDLQVFTLLKTECLLMDQNSKSFYEGLRDYTLYTMFADMIVVEHVEDFYKQFMDFCGFMAKYEPTYSGFEYPQISDFETLETMNYGSSMAGVAFEDSVLHGSYYDYYAGQQAEGMFTGSLCRGFESSGVGCNMMYNINAVTAPYGEMGEYQELLTQIFSSIQYTDTFVSTVMTDLQIKAEAAAQLNQTLQQTSDIIMQGWEERQASYDIISAKQSDATLGYERVYDVDTGEVYRAYNGFTDLPDIDNYYKPITDDMYSLPVAGYIEK